MMLLFRCLLTVFLLFFATNGWAVMHVTGGTFIYQVESSTETLSYRVKAVRYHGVEAWHMRWHSTQLDADHFIRRDNGAPIYVHRVLHHLQQDMEIYYGQTPDEITVYRLHSHGRLVIEKRVGGRHLVDFATLPQLLRQQPSQLRDIEVINYADGNIYPLKVSVVGPSQFAMDDKPVASIRYRIEVDSWLSLFGPIVQLDIPVDRSLADLATYSGPDFMGSRHRLTLHLLSAVVDG